MFNEKKIEMKFDCDACTFSYINLSNFWNFHIMKLNFFSNKNNQTTTPPTPSQEKGVRITKETQNLYQSTGWTLNYMTPFLIKMKTFEKFLLKMWLSSNTSNISIKYLLHRKMVSPILFQTIRLCNSYAFEANLV